MADIDFRHFDPRSFEQFIQALASKVLGEGLLVFGDGPDGGREASFEGVVPYPSKVDCWDGYTVLQAKFRQKLSRSTDDVSWLIKQLKKELTKFEENLQLRRPQFYILATNVSLSSVTGNRNSKGGQEKIDAVFKTFGIRLGIKEYRVWHPTVLQTLLEDAPNLRQKYIGWISPQEVLAEAFSFFKAKSADLKATMLLYLQRELRHQRATRLQQAGHLTDAPTYLENVFVDLPVLDLGPDVNTLNRLLLEDEESFPNTDLLLRNLLCRASTKLDPLTLKNDHFHQSAGTRPDRCLVLGGPGQGKSTISQFFGQVLRARLLSSEKEQPLPPDIEEIVDSIKRRLDREGLPFDGPRRFPIRVDLPALADALAKAQESASAMTLIGYVASHIAAVTETTVEVEDIRGWLAAYPWVLLLDGLDEVPPSSNRDAVIKTIVEFWDDAFTANADIFMVVTTRPQGYNDDLDPRLYGKLELARLQPDQALNYAEQLAANKLPDPERRQRVLGRLREATQNPTTALLLISPLQVAILFALVDQRGQSPRDRWTLFHEYFGVVMKREQEKPGSGGEVVKNRARPIAHILQKAAFLLHVDGEDVGGAEAYLTPLEFRNLIQSQLEEDGFRGEELQEGIEEISFGATNRLVFLEQREEGRLAFDVRSLQEYMAAAHIMAAAEAKVQARLRETAARTHWQHVFKISASKCFSAPDTEQFRDTVVTICRELDLGGFEDRAARTGGVLALSLLADGLAFDQPRYQRMLLTQALELTRLGPEAVSDDLIQAALAERTDLVATTLKSAIMDGSATQRLGAWRLTLELNAKEAVWTETLVEEAWPSDPDEQLRLAFLLVRTPTKGAFNKRVEKTFFSLGPAPIVRALGAYGHREVVAIAAFYSDQFPFFQLFRSVTAHKLLQLPLLPDGGTALSLRVVPIGSKSGREPLSEVPNTEAWHSIGSIGAFSRDPSRHTLAAALRSGADDMSFFVVRAILHRLPWPFANVHFLAHHSAELRDLADRAEAGEFGDGDDWLMAESRLKEGVLREDLLTWTRDEFQTPNISKVGAPVGGTSLSLSMGQADSPAWLDTLIKISRHSKSELGRRAFARVTNFPLGSYRPSFPLSADDAHRLFFYQGTDGSDWRFNPRFLDLMSPEALEDPQFLDLLESVGEKGRVVWWDDEGGGADIATRLALGSPEKPGFLLVALSAGIAEVSKLAALAAQLRDLAEKALSDKSPIVKEGAAALLLVAGHAEGDTALLKLICCDNGARQGVRTLIVAARAGLIETDRAMAALAYLMINCPHLNVEDRAELRTELLKILDRRRSRLTEQTCWKDLGFGPELFEALHARVALRLDGTDKQLG